MSHEITITQAAERAHQAEVICLMLETYPNKMADSELIAVATLLRRLTGDVSVWLIEEQALRGEKS
ncbi:MAG: hypothetical protein P4L95_13105 [Rouxiella aceris]|uniref:hypothetical protein n=1 Tax=Rouxiella aceris TaxID=2703884 RepID=UPI00283DC78F|nr:hypothetical protein [Rouxiella aceris]MDR3432819.1 hypothetical protein [Rouxiella aceris]